MSTMNGSPSNTNCPNLLLSKHKRFACLAFGHAVAFAAVYWLAFAIRLDFAISTREAVTIWHTLPLVLPIKLFAFYAFGHFHGWWMHATIRDLASILWASIVSLVVILAASYLLTNICRVPRGVPFLDAMLTMLLLGGVRASWRVVKEEVLPLFRHEQSKAAVLVGTDYDTARLAHSMHSYPEANCRVKGFLCLSGQKVGDRLGQIPVLGDWNEIEQVTRSRRIDEVLVLAGKLPGAKMRELMEKCERLGLELKVVPQAAIRLEGKNTIPLRDIEINDLLQRDPIQLDESVIKDLVEGRRIMVTGAGGSIGSEICRQLIKFNPESLVLLGRGENRLFFLERELRELNLPTKITVRIADVVSRRRMAAAFEEYRPEVVFHAAAHKHVPLMEANVGEAIRNNILGTKNVADLSDEYDVKTFVLVSTDKAVNPTNVMGTTKHMAERYVHALSQESSTRFIVTRFGNVLGSAGSVVPIFKQQIAKGGPITVTDERMTRFFMTIPEASQLVLQAAAMGKGGEIFVLDMGEPVKIVDMARDMIRLAGLPEDAIEIRFSGIRPGEKLYEELYFDDEETLPTSHPKLRAAASRMHVLEDVRYEIGELAGMLSEPNDRLRAKLQQLVPEYQPSVGLPASSPALNIQPQQSSSSAR